jgi:hypothetical protein
VPPVPPFGWAVPPPVPVPPLVPPLGVPVWPLVRSVPVPPLGVPIWPLVPPVPDWPLVPPAPDWPLVPPRDPDPLASLPRLLSHEARPATKPPAAKTPTTVLSLIVISR